MIEERSAGAVVYSEHNEDIHFLLLNYPTGHWDFPKGKIEKDELTLETVKREVLEETGIQNLEIIPNFKRNIVYYYRRNAGMVHKEVIYVLARTFTTDITLSHEHKDYVWLKLEEAINKVTYKNSKNTLIAAAKFLNELPIHPDESFL